MLTAPVLNATHPPPGPPLDSPASAGERVVFLGQQLAVGSQALLAALPTPVRTSADLVKAIGVNKDIAGRFLTALAKRDPLALVYYMPGVESLRRISRGARTRVENPDALAAFDDAISAYEKLLQDELGGRHALDAMASAWLPEARERFESASRQMAYRAAANLRGVECQTILDAAMICPGADPDRYDHVSVQGLVGVRRLRPAVTLTIATYDRRGDTAGRPTFTIDGRRITTGDSPDEMLPQFRRGDPLALRVVRAGSSSAFQLVSNALGIGAASDVFFGVHAPGLFRRWARFPGDIAAHMEIMEVPAQRLVLDVLLHPDVWPDMDPELMLYDTCVRGTASVNDRARDADRVDMLDSSRLLGKGVDCCRVGEAPRYVDLLRWACDQRKWDPNAFRVYRCDSRYPVVGVQYAMAFHLDPRPDTPAVGA